jgi:hypothetical protein
MMRAVVVHSVLKSLALASDLTTAGQAEELLPVVYATVLHVIAPAKADDPTAQVRRGAGVGDVCVW